jgi:hypothetical protein
MNPTNSQTTPSEFGIFMRNRPIPPTVALTIGIGLFFVFLLASIQEPAVLFVCLIVLIGVVLFAIKGNSITAQGLIFQSDGVSIGNVECKIAEARVLESRISGSQPLTKGNLTNLELQLFYERRSDSDSWCVRRFRVFQNMQVLSALEHGESVSQDYILLLGSEALVLNAGFTSETDHLRLLKGIRTLSAKYDANGKLVVSVLFGARAVEMSQNVIHGALSGGLLGGQIAYAISQHTRNKREGGVQQEFQAMSMIGEQFSRELHSLADQHGWNVLLTKDVLDSSKR